MRIEAALAAGLALIAIALVVTLSHSPATLAGVRSVPPEKQLVSTMSNAYACQSGEVLPRDTSAIRLGLFAVISPEVSVKVLAGSRRIAEGTLGLGWSGAEATVPVNEVPHAVSPVKVCFALKDVASGILIMGRATPPAEAAVSQGKPLPGRISIEYLQPGHRSWWSLAASVARRLGLGRAASGTWNALLVLALTATVLALSSWLVMRELR